MVVEVRVLSSAPLDSVASLFRSWQAIRLALPFASRLAHGRPRYLATEANGVLPALSEAFGRIEGSERSESKGTSLRSPSACHIPRVSYGLASQQQAKAVPPKQREEGVWPDRCEGGPPPHARNDGPFRAFPRFSRPPPPSRPEWPLCEVAARDAGTMLPEGS